MGMLDAKTKAAIRRGAWCNDTSIPQHIRDANKLPSERALTLQTRIPTMGTIEPTTGTTQREKTHAENDIQGR